MQFPRREKKLLEAEDCFIWTVTRYLLGMRWENAREKFFSATFSRNNDSHQESIQKSFNAPTISPLFVKISVFYGSTLINCISVSARSSFVRVFWSESNRDQQRKHDSK